ncbi:MAG TPA: helix-turn-helix domain-containing protein [Blastocatellia bacterium]
MSRNVVPQHGAALEEGQLLELYLSLNPVQRAARFADTAQAAEMTGVTRRAIQQWVATGTIRGILVGKKYRIDLESLRLYLKQRACDWGRDVNPV